MANNPGAAGCDSDDFYHSSDLSAMLAGAEHRIFQCLRRREAQPRSRRNLDLCSGRRVAAHPRLGPALAENAETRETQRTFALKLAHYQCSDFVERALRLLLTDTELVGQMSCDLRLRHHPPPYCPRNRASDEGWTTATRFASGATVKRCVFLSDRAIFAQAKKFFPVSQQVQQGAPLGVQTGKALLTGP